ncbi:MAG: GNAT family N-acetyltransferase, partial [Enterorhabdus sp.]|nr:GNAT family N-acetyltransferase [Enterorhabdus sp.]
MDHSRLYLVTDLVGFYEKCGWEYVGEVNELDGGP